ncbi:hypothetical protein Tco_1300440 [Tanacetum coccineum]
MSRGDGAWWCRYDDDYDDGGFGGGDGYDDDDGTMMMRMMVVVVARGVTTAGGGGGEWRRVRIYQKNHMKTVKSKQTRTRERMSEQKPEAKPEKATSAMVKAQVYVGFVLDSLTKEAQAVTSRNDSLAILECTQFDQTAINHLEMIRRFKG